MISDSLLLLSWKGEDMKTKEHLDRLFIASLVRDISNNSEISETGRIFYNVVAESLSNLKEGWWLQSIKDNTDKDQAVKLAREISGCVFQNYQQHVWKLTYTDVEACVPLLGVEHKSSLMVIISQALHHIDWYGRQKIPKINFIPETIDGIPLTRKWLQKLLVPYERKDYYDSMKTVISHLFTWGYLVLNFLTSHFPKFSVNSSEAFDLLETFIFINPFTALPSLVQIFQAKNEYVLRNQAWID